MTEVSCRKASILALNQGDASAFIAEAAVLREQIAVPSSNIQWQRISGKEAALTEGVLEYTVVELRLGKLFLAGFNGCLLGASFIDDKPALARELVALQQQWPLLALEHKPALTAQYGAYFSHKPHKPHKPEQPLRLLAQASDFQVTVWQALLAIRAGQVFSYAGFAEAMGRPSATRAVASAIAKNVFAYIVPCHRVVKGDGAMHQYRWGAGVKQALLERELLVSSS